MIKRIDHVGIAVRDLKKAKSFFLDGLGGRELFSGPMPQHGFRWTTIELGTSCFLELIDPMEESESSLHRFLQNRGEGVHHITIQVDDLQETRRILEERGIPTFGYSEALPGWKEMFIHPREAFGVLVQFAEFNPLDWIAPGYIPPSYREFVPPGPGGSKEAPVQIRKTEDEQSPGVEIRQGNAVIHIPESQLKNFLEELKKKAVRA